MKVGVQLYTLRSFTQNEKDLEESLKRISQIGYTEVQISAVGPISAEKIRTLCDRYGLSIVLTHTNPDRILNDTEAVIAEHKVMGCDYIGIGCMPERYKDPAWMDRFVLDYKEAAKKIAAAGKRLMYHNHDFEFEKINGRCVMDFLTESFEKEELSIILDTYWVQAAGADPVFWIHKLSDRLPCVHLKDMGMHLGRPVMAPVLEGNMNFDAILKALEDNKVTKHLLVEQDTCLESPFVCLEKSYRNLADKGYR